MIATAISRIRPNAIWTLRDGGYAGLEWLDTKQPKPTEAEVSDEVARLEAAHAATQYRRDRVYPPIGDQLDALWKGGAAAEEMLAQIHAVKARYPKGA